MEASDWKEKSQRQEAANSGFRETANKNLPHSNLTCHYRVFAKCVCVCVEQHLNPQTKRKTDQKSLPLMTVFVSVAPETVEHRNAG